MRSEIHALRLFLGGEELRRISHRLTEAGAEEASRVESVALTVREFDQIEASLEKLADLAGVAGQTLDRDTAAAARLETTAERLRSISTVAAERCRSLIARLEGAGERRGDLLAEAKSCVSTALSIEDQSVAADAAERTARVLATLEDEERSLAEQEAMPAEGAIAIVRGDLRSNQAANDRAARAVRSRSVLTRSSLRSIARRAKSSANTDILDLDEAGNGPGGAHGGRAKPPPTSRSDMKLPKRPTRRTGPASATVRLRRSKGLWQDSLIQRHANEPSRRLR